MRAGGLTLALLLALAAMPASADPRAQWFADALALDATGTPAGARQAFRLYLRAAREGLPEAQFNVAVMLDSGRGVPRDMPGAALWYGRAAARGFARAAFNLAQLYEGGEGVPRNGSLALGWYRASRLPAARGREPPPEVAPAAMVAPVTAPTLARESCASGCELVWMSGPQPSDTVFVVEVRRPAGPDSLVFSGALPVSGLLFVSAQPGPLLWRVSAVSDRARAYLSSPWRMLVRP